MGAMPLAPRLATCLLLPLLAACTTTAAPPAVDDGLRGLVGRMPARIGAFELQESMANKASDTAWTLRYLHAPSGTVASVMLSTPGQPSVPDGPNSPQVQTIVNALSLGVQAAAGGAGLTRMPDFGAARTGRAPEVRCTDLRMQPPQGPLQRVLVCATGVADSLAAVSLVARHPPEAGDAAKVFMTSFVLQAMEALRTPPGAEPPPIDAIQPATGAGRVFRL